MTSHMCSVGLLLLFVFTSANKSQLCKVVLTGLRNWGVIAVVAIAIPISHTQSVSEPTSGVVCHY